MVNEEISLDILDKNTHKILLKLLCYPLENSKEFRKRLVELKLLGIKSVLPGGKTIINNFPVLGKGTTSIVLKGRYIGNRIVTIKVRRLDSNRPSVIHEARMLRIANMVNVGPKLLTYSRNFIIWEYINGIPLVDFLKEERDLCQLRSILRELLLQTYRLDKIGLTHLELSRPENHILITKELRPVLIDFETATLHSKKRNLTQVLNFLIFRRKEIREKLEIQCTLDELRQELREYKRGPELRFKKIVRMLNLEK